MLEISFKAHIFVSRKRERKKLGRTRNNAKYYPIMSPRPSRPSKTGTVKSARHNEREIYR